MTAVLTASPTRDDDAAAGTVPPMVRPAPILRWAGGKRRLLPQITAATPASFGTYFEPFVGGAAVFFAAAAAQRLTGGAVINDVNPDLVALYTVLRDHPDDLIDELAVLAKDVSADRFYEIRAQVPATDLDRAARMLYLNRTCFNGLYRVNSSGAFNVPHGKLKNPEVCNTKLLRSCSAALQGVTILNGGYAAAVAAAKPGDFVYLDPPYIPLNATSSFSKYSKDDFTLPDQKLLAELIADLTARGVYVMLSNSDTTLTREVYDIDGFELHSVEVSRSISAAAGSRNRVGEILGVNYEPAKMADSATFLSLTTEPATLL